MPLQYIFHLSDLHIRNGDCSFCRYEEYNDVFNETIKSINNNIIKLNLKFDDFIIVITGDIFHNKNVIGNYGLLIYKDFIQSLSKIGRLIIFSGNHDIIQSDNNIPSLVFSSSFDIPNLTILNESQTFKIDDIGFSFVSIEKTLDNFRNSGRIQELPPFPVIKDNVKFKIALFHGTFAGSKLYNGETINQNNNPYPLEWVEDFDFVLLGDIHKRQIFTYKNKTIYGYSGSLIQQNFGEDIIKHGYLLWNLNDKKIKEFDIYNKIGYINIKEDNNEEILIRLNGKYEKMLKDVINDNLELFPKKIEIKIFSKINFNILNSLLKSYNINYNIISRLDEKRLILNDNIDFYNDYQNKENLDNIINNEFILSYFKQFLSTDKYTLLNNIIQNKELLLFDINKYPQELHNECNKRNKDLSFSIHSCMKEYDNKIIKHPFIIRYLEWEGLFCYENKNWINMTDLDAKTFMVKGKNGTGKSAIYDILLLAIWGKTKKCKHYTSGIINHNKTSAYTIIDIEINGELFRIYRNFYIKSDNKGNLDNKHTTFYKIIDNKHLEIISKDTASKDKITDLFGDMDSFLFSSMITQNIDNDILKLEAKDILKVIDKSFNIDYIYHLYNLFKIAINKYTDFRKIIQSKKEVYEKLVSLSNINDFNDDEFISNKEQLSILIEEKNQLENDFDNIKVDIKDPKTLTIIRTDYNLLINSLDLSKLISIDKYNEYINRYNELNFILKDEDLNFLYKSYNPNLKLDVVIKPCELSFLEKEKDKLKDYLSSFNINYDDDIDDLNNNLSILNNQLLDNEELLKDMISNKTNNVIKPTISKNTCLKDINHLYNSFEGLKEYISNNPKLSISFNKQTLKQKYINNNISLLDYNNYKQRFNELSYLLKDINIIIPPNYNPENDEKDILNIINKPCELSFLTNEKYELNDYLSSFNSNDTDTFDDLNIELSSLKDNLTFVNINLNELISNKPTKFNKSIDKDFVFNKINTIFNNNQTFLDFISSNNSNIKSNSINNDFQINYDTYKSIIINKNKLENNIIISKQQLSKLDEEFNNNYIKQQQLTIINKPDFLLNNKSLKTSISVSKELNSINYEKISNDIIRIDNLFNDYNININRIKELQDLLDNYKNELSLFSPDNNDNFYFNPNCDLCCKRPWVCRIKELELLINKLNDDISSLNKIINDFELNNNSILLTKTNENNKKTILYYNSLILWYDYYKSKEEYDKFTKKNKNIITDKYKLNDTIKNNEITIINYNKQIQDFISTSFHFYELFNSIKLYDNYKIWEDKYNLLYTSSNDLNSKIKNLENKINYNTLIKPRILNYLKLLDDYQKWNDYNHKLNLIRTFEFNNIKNLLFIYELNNIKSYELFELFNSIELYETFKIWQHKYNLLLKTSNDLKSNIKDLENKINYNTFIKPRILNYLKLFDDYQKWTEYDFYLKTIRTFELFSIKEHIELFDKFQLYNKNKNLQPLINTKIHLSNSLKSKNIIINNLNDKIIKFNTIHHYNQSNKDNYEKLFFIITDLDILIDTLQTIILNFQTFKIDMYENQILNNLILKTNQIIKKICHKDTKPFQLDYNIYVSKDIIHIDWLIKNDNIGLNNNKQIISIAQASGFQHFVISLALRMCLFNNNFKIQSNQLFIDEGFINFDKYNLSMVPSFLKTLLSYFNNIIIVSHIDLIQDTMDEIAEIHFNKSNSISSMTFNNLKNDFITTRNNHFK